MTSLRRIQFTLLVIVSGLALLLSACSAAGSPYPMSSDAQTISNMPESAPGSMAPAEESFVSQYNAANPQVDRLVIKNGSLTLVVSDPAQSMDNIGRLAEEMGGFIVSANLDKMRLESGAEVPRASITIRVPADQLDEALSQIEAESSQPPRNKNINSQDITGDYTDLQSRLRNLEDAEEQLREIMASATRTEDVLTVFNQLTQVREQIEVLKGQISYYDQSVALSLLSVELLPNEAVLPLTIGTWQPVGVAKSAIQALINTLKFLLDAIIWIILYLLPTLLVLFIIFVLPLVLLVRVLRRLLNRGKKPVQPAAGPAAPPVGPPGKA